MGELIPLSHWLLDETPRAVARRGAEIIERDRFCARVSAWMDALRDRPGERFALFHGDSAEFLAILLALWQLRRIACVAGDNQPGTIAQLGGRVDGFVGEFPGVSDAVAAAAPGDREPPPWQVLDEDRVLLEMYTSGSSGEPKAIAKSIGQLQRELDALQAQWPEDPDSVSLATVTHQHFYGLMIALLWPFCAGRAFASRLCEFPEDIIQRGARLPRFILVERNSLIFTSRFEKMRGDRT